MYIAFKWPFIVISNEGNLDFPKTRPLEKRFHNGL